MSDQTQEPTMEEILASIRRIISEDEPAAEAEAPAAEAAPQPEAAPEPEPEPEPVAFEDDVMDLTEVVEEPAPATLGDLEISDAPVAAAPAYEPEPAPAPVYTPPPAPEPIYAAPTPTLTDDTLLSPSAAADVSSAFGSLSQRIGMPNSSTTLDGVVRELLRPLLSDWLDQNLRAIVEAKVEEEVERQSRRARS